MSNENKDNNKDNTKIKYNDLKKAIALDRKENIKLVDYNGLTIQIKQYLPITEKVGFASAVYNSAKYEDTDLNIISENTLDIAFKNLLVETYTNLTLSKNPIESYDMLVDSGLYNVVCDNIPEKELLDLQQVLENHIITKQNEFEQSMKLEYIIKNAIDNLLFKLENFVSSIPSTEEMKELPDIVKNVYGQMKSGIDNLKGDDKEYARIITRAAIEDAKNGS